MTTVAVRGDTMAADSAIWVEDTLVFKIRKTHRLKNGSICGYCGTVDSALGVIRWLDGDADEKVRFDDVTVLVLTPTGRLLKYDGEKPVPLTRAEYVAIGTGASIALGAMHQGATAIEAIKAAIAHDSKTRGPVNWLKIE